MSTKLHSEPAAATERTPLFATSLKGGDTTPSSSSPTTENSRRVALFLFLEARTPAGLRYETFTIILILLSVTTFILGSLFLPEYNIDSSIATKCDSICDAIWFGNYSDNSLEGLGIGATSLVEIFIVGIFTIDYLLRFYTADLIDEKYSGVLVIWCSALINGLT